MSHFFEIFDWAKFLAGLAILLFGLNLLEECSSSIWETAQSWIKKYTKWVFKSIIIWTVVTTVLQSSSVVSLIVIAFVWSGVLWLSEWIWMIIGANIWTTIVDNLIAFFSFHEWSFNINSIIRPMIWIGGIWWFFIKKYKNLFYGIFGIGILFLGLGFMKEAMSILPSLVNVDIIAWYPIIVFVLFGIFMAGMMHSSSGTMLMTIAAVNSWVLTLEMWVAIIIWANIWTCFTAILGSFGKSYISREIANSHLYFNIFTAIIFCLLFPRVIPVLKMLNIYIANLLSYVPSSEKALILFVFLFDTIWAIIVYPFMKYFIKFIAWITPKDKSQNMPLLFIEKLDGLTWKYAMEALSKDVKAFYEKCKKYNLDQINLQHGQDNATKFKQYNDLKYIYEKIIKYISSMDQVKLPKVVDTTVLQNIINNCFYSVKYLEDIDHNIYKLFLSENKVCQEYFDYFVKTTNQLYIYLDDYKKNEWLVSKMLSDIQIDDQYFIDKFVNKNSDIDSINGISDIITIHKYYFISCEDIVDASLILSNL